MSFYEEMREAIEEISETPTYLLGYRSESEYHPVKMFDSIIDAREHYELLNPYGYSTDGKEWVLIPTTIGKGIDLINEEDERRMSEMNNQKEFKYRLKHKMTGQYVSYLGIEKYEEDSLLPKKIDAIEFVDDSEDADVLTYEYTDLDTSGKLKYSPMEKLELFYFTFFLDVEKVEEDEKYLFYSEDLDSYFNYIEIESALNGSSFVLDSVPSISAYDLRNSGTNNKEIIELFEQKTNFHKVKVSDID